MVVWSDGFPAIGRRGFGGVRVSLSIVRVAVGVGVVVRRGAVLGPALVLSDKPQSVVRVLAVFAVNRSNVRLLLVKNVPRGKVAVPVAMVVTAVALSVKNEKVMIAGQEIVSLTMVKILNRIVKLVRVGRWLMMILSR